MNNNQSWEFTCTTCGAHKLTVYRVWKILAGPESEIWQEWGALEADHTWVFKFKDNLVIMGSKIEIYIKGFFFEEHDPRGVEIQSFKKSQGLRIINK